MILISGIHGNSKHQNPGSHFGATSYTALPIQLISLKIGPNWPNQQCCLAGSSKTAPRILTVSIAMGANNSFYVKSIATYAPTFLGYIISVLAMVQCNSQCSENFSKLPLKFHYLKIITSLVCTDSFNPLSTLLHFMHD